MEKYHLRERVNIIKLASPSSVSIQETGVTIVRSSDRYADNRYMVLLWIHEDKKHTEKRVLFLLSRENGRF